MTEDLEEPEIQPLNVQETDVQNTAHSPLELQTKESRDRTKVMPPTELSSLTSLTLPTPLTPASSAEQSCYTRQGTRRGGENSVHPEVVFSARLDMNITGKNIIHQSYILMMMICMKHRSWYESW